MILLGVIQGAGEGSTFLFPKGIEKQFLLRIRAIIAHIAMKRSTDV
jgi:hypothetical protein